MKPNEFQCYKCKGVFEKGWSDEEALAELAHNFAAPQEDCELICDDCYQDFQKWFASSASGSTNG